MQLAIESIDVNEWNTFNWSEGSKEGQKSMKKRIWRSTIKMKE